MNNKLFNFAVALPAVVFLVIFIAVVIPPLLSNFDLIAAFAAGFVNPYASGYSSDVIACWAILAVWVVFDTKHYAVRHGWVCLLLGIIPGVAVGFAGYLILRNQQVKQSATNP